MVSIALLTIINLATVAKVVIIKPTMGTLLDGQVTSEGVRKLALVLAVIFLGGYLANYVYSVTNKVVAGRVTMNIRRQIFDHMLGQPLGFFSNHHSTDLASRVVNDIGAFEFSTITMLQMFIRDVMASLMFLGVMFYLDWQMALICLAIGGCIAGALAYHNRRIAPLAQRTQRELGGVASHVTELISGMELVVSFGMGKRWIDRFGTINQTHFDAAYDLEKTRAKAVFVTHALSGLAVVLIVFITGTRIVQGRLLPEDGMTIIAVMYMLQAPLASVSNQVTQIVRGLGAAGRAFELLDVEPEVQDPVDPAPFPERMDIEFRNVTFAYDDKPVLTGRPWPSSATAVRANPPSPAWCCASTIRPRARSCWEGSRSSSSSARSSTRRSATSPRTRSCSTGPCART